MTPGRKTVSPSFVQEKRPFKRSAGTRVVQASEMLEMLGSILPRVSILLGLTLFDKRSMPEPSRQYTTGDSTMEFVEIIGALIALTQACIAFAVFWSSHKSAELDRKLQDKRAALDREILHERKSVDRGLRRIVQIHSWGNNCIDAFAEARQFCQSYKSDFPDERTYMIRRRDLLAKLSALIDQGRLFFRNTNRKEYNVGSFPARRGFRPEILDPLMFAFRCVQRMDGSADEGRSDRLGRWQSLFVSLLQYEIEPDWRQRVQHYGDGPGKGPGLGITADVDPPPWDETRPLPGEIKQV